MSGLNCIQCRIHIGTGSHEAQFSTMEVKWMEVAIISLLLSKYLLTVPKLDCDFYAGMLLAWCSGLNEGFDNWCLRDVQTSTRYADNYFVNNRF